MLGQGVAKGRVKEVMKPGAHGGSVHREHISVHNSKTREPLDYEPAPFCSGIPSTYTFSPIFQGAKRFSCT